jgi:hypothetical protein
LGGIIDASLKTLVIEEMRMVVAIVQIRSGEWWIGASFSCSAGAIPFSAGSLPVDPVVGFRWE